MDRRTFLMTGATGIAGVWLAPRLDAFTATDGGPVDLAKVIKTARETGRPVLALIVPRDVSEALERAKTFGAWLDHADTALLVDLALVDVVCAPLAALREHAPEVSQDAESWMVLLDPTGDVVKARALTAELPARIRMDPVNPTARREAPSASAPGSRDPGKLAVQSGTEAEAIASDERRSRVLSRLVRDALLPDPDALASLAAHVRDKLSENDRSAFDAYVAGEATSLPAALRVRASAPLRVALRADAKRRSSMEATLGKLVAHALREDAPPGARWEVDRGCPAGSPCGAGFVAEMGRRFLAFYDTWP